MNEVLENLSAEIRRHRLQLGLATLFIVAGSYLTAVVLTAVEALYHGAALSTAVFAPSVFHLAILGSIPITAGSLVLEARLMGWERSSLNRLFRSETRSIRSDLVYGVLYCSHTKLLLSLLMSFGTAYYFRARILDHFNYNLLGNLPFAGMLAAQFFIGSFVLYVYHRLCHSRFFWEFHKVHHCGEDMTMINNFRDHPVFDTFRMALEALPTALLGITPLVFVIYSAVVGALSLWFHSDFDWKMPFVEKYILIGSKAHRIHHSPLAMHHHKNFGWLVLWERVFGTYCEDPAEIPIGLVDPRYNSRGTFAEMWTSLGAGMRTLLIEVVRLVQPASERRTYRVRS